MGRRRILAVAGVLVAFALVAAPAFGAPKFENVSVSNAGWRIVGGSYVGADRMGLIASSADGTTWQTEQKLNKWFNGVSSDSGRAWAVSTESQDAWTAADSPITMPWSAVGVGAIPAKVKLWDVTAMGPDSAIAVGERLTDPDYGDLASAWKTEDGGSTWTEVLAEPKYAPGSDGGIPQSIARLSSVDSSGTFVVAAGAEFSDSTYSYSAVKRPMVFTSTSSGSDGTWTLSSPVGADWQPYDVSVPSPGVAWVAGTSATVIRTTNSGSTWTSFVLPAKLGMLMSPNGIAALDDSTAVVVGDRGRVSRTINGGTSWTSIDVTATPLPDLVAVAMRSPEEIMVVGNTGVGTADIAGVAFLTHDGGASWTKVDMKLPKTACAVKVTPPATVHYGTAAKITVSLRSGSISGSAISGKALTLKKSVSGKWTTVTSLTVPSGGSGTFSTTLSSKTSYMVSFAGDSSYEAANSAQFTITPEVKLGTPAMSSISGRTLTASGTLQPRHTAKTKPVVIYASILSGHKWVRKAHYHATVANYSSYSKYSVRLKLPSRGTWRLQANAPTDSQHYSTWSSPSKSRAFK